MRRVYLDHTATTPLDSRVRDAMMPYFSETYGNASSVHWFGRQAKSALEEARGVIAQAIGAEPGELLFTSGGTESDNLALRGTATASRRRGKDQLITTTAEHHAVLDPAGKLAAEGWTVTKLDVDGYGSVSADDVSRAITEKTFLVSVMHANNEVGTISPLTTIAEAVRARGIPTHTDAVQTVGRIPVDVGALGVDLMTFSAHKLYGPKGIGALFVRRGTELDPLLLGGGQERGKRPGTENVALAVGFARAVQLAVAEMEVESARLGRLRDRLEDCIRRSLPEALVNGHPEDRLPHILNISFDSRRIALEGEMLVMGMDLHGIAVTSGSACTSGSMQPSHVLLAMGRDPETAKATLRFSFGRQNSEEDVHRVLEVLTELLRKARKA